MPATTQQELTGFARVQAQLFLPGQTLTTSLDELLVFKEASFKENVFSGLAEYTITYSTTTLDFIEKVLKAAELTGTPKIRFRYGYGQPETTTQWSPWQDGIVIQTTSMPMNIGNKAGHDIMLVIGNSLYTAARSKRTLVRKGFISDMVAQIAAALGLDAVIEPTQNQFAYIQSYMDDVTFIADRLQPRATNANGRGNYVFYVRDSVLHFHTPDYQATYSELNYYESPHMSMGQNSLGQMLFDKGVSGTRLVAYDPYTAQTRELLSDPSKALKLSDTLPAFSSVPLGERNIAYHLSENRPEESVNIGQNAHERARMNAFKATLNLQKVVSIRAGDFLNLVVSPITSRTSTWSGVYFVLDTTYVIKDGAITATITVTRGEIAATIGQSTTQTPNLQLVAETAAPGHPINLRDMQNSQKTKGAGQPTSTTTFANVVDANNAPS